ncbi:diacylglycerol/lipid kinase family protein [Luteolibacter algae]|uniref:Diacylglycerol/lipid kinase family protein n=1 Tax=Luteolibacter algae TaxID=454151 RepID=A0ABW5DDA0_9BACT
MLYEIVINRESGSGIFKDPAQQKRLSQIFSEHGHEADISVVAPGDLEATLKEKSESAGHALIVGGGDGTITSAASILHGKTKALGVLPLGTFNLEARDLKIDLDPFKAAEQLISAEVKAIDLMSVNGEFCLCATVIGFYPTLAKARDSFHGRSWWTKSIRIVREIATVAVRAPALDLKLTSRSGTVHRKTRLAAFAPGHYRENIGLIPDRDSLASGELSAYVSAHLTRLEMLSAALGYLSGNLFDTEGMTRIETDEITINVRGKRKIPAMIDGEIVSMSLPCQLKIHPKALNVLSPQ